MEDELSRLRTGNWRAAYENSQHALPFVDGDFMYSHHRYWFLWIPFFLLAFFVFKEFNETWGTNWGWGTHFIMQPVPLILRLMFLQEA